MNNIMNNNMEMEVLGLSGLRNLGNTCYMNAVLQCLSNTPIICDKTRTAYSTDKFQTGTHSHTKQTITYNLGKLFDVMWESNCTVVPEAMKIVIGRLSKEFNGFRQNDSQELLGYILDSLHEENKGIVQFDYRNVNSRLLKYIDYIEKCKKFMRFDLSESERNKVSGLILEFERNHPLERTLYNYQKYLKTTIEKNYSFITSDITGNYYSRITCLSCKNSYDKFEPFTILTLNTELGDMTLNESINNFTKIEYMNGENKYYCESCKRNQDAAKQLYIWTPPNVLVLHLKRFVYRGERAIKTESFIKYPVEHLSIANNICSINPSDSNYRLFGVIEHHGECGGGHYTAVCRNRINDMWYRFDDSRVYRIPNSRVDDVVSNRAYVLFYIKV